MDDLTASHWDDVVSPNTGSTFNINSAILPPSNEFGNMSFKEASDNDDDEEEEAQPNGFGTQQSMPELPSDPIQDQLEDLRREEKTEQKEQLLSELTSDHDTITTSPPPDAESLFNIKDSPVKLASETKRTISVAGGPRRAPRHRKHHISSVLEHLDPNDSHDPLSVPSEESHNKDGRENHGESLVRQADAPLYNVTAKSQEDKLRELNSVATDAAPRSSTIEAPKLSISVGDPVKVGDITNAYIVYSIKTKGIPTDEGNNNAEHVVTRRYKDFRWLYHQLQVNHPGRIIPPPPTKQTYIGRFNENFIENRRFSLEKMLNKICTVAMYCTDADFVRFLTDVEFTCDAKDADNSAEDDVVSVAATADASSGGFMSLFSMVNKATEPDDYFVKKKSYIDDLESNLRRFHKSLELVGTQRLELISVLDEMSLTLEELSAFEISKGTSELLLGFGDVQLKLKENLDRINMQDQLTLGFTIEEYLRIIGSVNYVFDTRSKIYHSLHSYSSELSKKEQQLEKLTRKHAAPQDKVNSLKFEIGRLKQKKNEFEESFNKISDVIKEDMANFEYEKIEDFRNSVEIFIENSIESQKEAIELYETFYEQHKL